MPPPKTTKKRSKFAPKKPTKKPTVSLQARVNQIINKKTETKLRTYTWANDVIISGGGLSLTGSLQSEYGMILPNLQDLIPLTQGTTQQTRVGNEITPKTLNVKGLIYSQPFDSKTNNSPLPFEVHLILYKYKQDPITNDPIKIKQLNSDATGPINGSALVDMCPWNKDQYVIYKHRIWRLKPNPAYTILTDPGTPPALPLIDPINSSFGSQTNRFFERFSLNIPIPKKFTYGDGLSTPSNFRMGLGMYIINGDGKAVAYNQVRAKVDLRATLYYTDQ